MINKLCSSARESIADVFDGAAIMIGGFVTAGSPIGLIRALREKGARNLTIITNNVGLGDELDTLCEARLVRKAIASFPFRPSLDNPSFLEGLSREGDVETQVVP